MIEADDIRDQMLTLCNLVSQDRPDAVLMQSCVLIANFLQARTAVLMMLDNTRQNFITGAGVSEGDTTWAPLVMSLPLQSGDSGQTPLAQVALTGRNLCLNALDNGYNLSPLDPLFPDLAAAGHICFVPMQNTRGDLIGVYIVSGENTLPGRLKSTDMILILRAVSAQVEQSSRQRAAAFHISALERSLELADKQRSNLRERARSNLQARLPGNSTAMQKLRGQVERFADAPGTILISGEDGTGREQVAREMHRLSRLSNAPFTYVNCATLTAESFAPELFGHKRGAIQGVATSRRGLLRDTGDGMIYFDRVDLLSEELQGSLSRLLDTGSFRPLGSSREVELTQRFAFSAPSDGPNETGISASLYHKVAQVGIHIQPLRERSEDIETLAHEFLIAVACERKQRLSFAPGSVAFLMRQELQGNMHELRAMITRASLQTQQDGVISPQHLGAKVNGKPLNTPASDLKASVESYEANLIRRALSDAENNRAQAAKNLGIPKRTLADKCLRYGL